MHKHFMLFIACFALVPALAGQNEEIPTKTKETAETPPRTLFDGKSLNGWELVDYGASGEATVENGAIDIQWGQGLSGVNFTDAKTLPVANYEVSLDAMKRDGSDFFCGITFPIGDRKTCATLVVGGWGGAVVGISSIDGRDASENETTTNQAFEPNQWYHIRLRVEKQRLQVWIDKKQLIDADITSKKVGMRHGSIDASMPFGLTAFQTSASWKNITVKKTAPRKP